MKLHFILFLSFLILGCSTTNPIPVTREPSFYNGKQVSYADFPYILHFNGSTGRAINTCGATLIHPRIAVTAAHCLIAGIQTIRLDGHFESSNALSWAKHSKAQGNLNGVDEIDFAYLILDRPMGIGKTNYPQIYSDFGFAETSSHRYEVRRLRRTARSIMDPRSSDERTDGRKR